MKEALDVQGFKFPESEAARWMLVPTDIRWASCKTLLDKFYEEFEWGKFPLGWSRNPVDTNGVAYFDPTTNPDIIVAPYRKNFYITIQRSYNEIFGPHAVRLMYRSWQIDGEFAWIAICQIAGMWHSDDKIKDAMIKAIEDQSFFQSEDTKEQLVLL